MRSPLRKPIVALLILWIAGVAFTWDRLNRYASTPGALGHAPADGVAPVTSGRHRLLLFLHPRCPCSSATLGELERALAQAPPRSVTVETWLFRPAGEPDAWALETRFARRTAALGPVRVDVEGRRAARFGARTSGTAVLYDPQGRLTFQGGLTSARAHEGSNLGTAALLDHLRGLEGGARLPVFGCPIQDAPACPRGSS